MKQWMACSNRKPDEILVTVRPKFLLLFTVVNLNVAVAVHKLLMILQSYPNRSRINDDMLVW